MSKLDMSELLESMGREQPKPETASRRDQRRKRVVGNMRRLHVELVHDRSRGMNVRRLSRIALVAAVVAFAGVAFAGFGGVGRWASRRSPDVPSAVVVTPAASPTGPARPGSLTAKAVAPPEPSDTAPSAPKVDAAIAPAEHGAPKSSVRHEQASNLEAVNRLFADAKRARREGHDRQALTLLDELLRGYPRSVLAQEASVERFRALSRLGRGSEAQREAASYLERYPNGFAREEARRLSAGSAPP